MYSGDFQEAKDLDLPFQDKYIFNFKRKLGRRNTEYHYYLTFLNDSISLKREGVKNENKQKSTDKQTAKCINILMSLSFLTGEDITLVKHFKNVLKT